MRSKKSPHVDIEKKRKIFLQMGFIVALSFALIAFEWTSTEYAASSQFSMLPLDDFMEEEVPFFKPKKKSSAPVKKEKLIFKVDPDPEPDPDPDPNLNPEPDPDPFDFGDDLFGDMGDFSNWEGEEEVIHMVVERMPHFADCENILDKEQEKLCTDQKIIEHLQRTVKYPQDMVALGMEGTVYCSFVVGSDGQVHNIEITRSPHKRFDAAVIAAVKTLPEFIPGNQQGKSVSVIMNAPVRFTLE